jgi:RND family efflux transporter MFP subunit
MSIETPDRASTRRLLDSLALDPPATAPRPPRARAWVAFAAAGAGFAAALALAWLLMSPRTDEAPSRGPVVATTADATPSKPAPVASTGGVQASGFVVARQQATVSADVTGRLAKILIQEGDRVRAGDLLAELDPRIATAQAGIAEAGVLAARRNVDVTQARLLDARQKLRRSGELAAKQYVSQAGLDAATNDVALLEGQLASDLAAVEVADRQLAMQRQQLASMRIVAPFDGVVTGLSAHVGEIVSPISAGGGFTRTGICTIVDLGTVEGEANISEQYLSRVFPGQRVQVSALAWPQAKVTGRVLGITPVVDRNTAALKVRIAFDAGETVLMPGMRIDLDFAGKEAP